MRAMRWPSWSAAGRAAIAMALAGVGLILGGEALCILGPLRYERLIGRVCHGMFYAGAALVGAALVLHLRAGRRTQ